MATELTKQQREDRQKAIQEARRMHPEWTARFSDELLVDAYTDEIALLESVIRAKRERDEAMRLIEWLRSMEIVEQMDRIDAFLAHKGESNDR